MSKEANMTFRVDRDLRSNFVAVTRQNDRPASQVLRDFMRSYVEHAKIVTTPEQIEQVLQAADPVRLSKLPVDKFADEIGELYTNLDYLHPFADGNSRTLRAFTQQLAKESGYALGLGVLRKSGSRPRSVVYRMRFKR